MSRSTHTMCALATAWMMLATGCMPTRQYYFSNEQDLAYYIDQATALEEPVVQTCSLDEVRYATRPLSVKNFEEHVPWELTLEEAIATALANSKVVRRLGVIPAPLSGGAGVASLPDALLSQPDAVATIYDPAIQESSTGGGFGGLGVEAALSAFDAQLAASMTWSRGERPINVGGIGNVIFARDFQQDRAIFQSELSKVAATGSRFFARQNVIYESNNNPTRGVPSDYLMNTEVGVTQPLLQGAGTLFNRIAGPGAQPGFYRGVMIARINNDITLTDFEAQVRNQVADVESAYWELYMAYRVFDARRRWRDIALENWRIEEAKVKAQLGAQARASFEQEAQARSQFYEARDATEVALLQLFQAESRLRYLMGLATNDGRVIRPIDEPTSAEVTFDWDEVHVEALARTVELRKARWRVKQRELELIAAKNFVLPRLDATALYRWVGAGDTLLDPGGRGVPPFAGSNALATLTDGNYQDWELGLNFSMPLGFRRELAGVRNAQLLLARERARLQDQELEVSALVSEAVRNVESHYQLLQTRYHWWIAALREREVLASKLKAGLDILYSDLLRAERQVTETEINYHRAVVNYNRALAEVHFRKGSLLEYNGVYLAEGPWPSKAYDDARRRAAERSYALPMNYAITLPAVVSRGPAESSSGLLYDEAVEPAVEELPEPPAPPSPGSPSPGRTAPAEPMPTPAQQPMPSTAGGPQAGWPGAAVAWRAAPGDRAARPSAEDRAEAVGLGPGRGTTVQTASYREEAVATRASSLKLRTDPSPGTVVHETQAH